MFPTGINPPEKTGEIPSEKSSETEQKRLNVGEATSPRAAWARP